MVAGEGIPQAFDGRFLNDTDEMLASRDCDGSNRAGKTIGVAPATGNQMTHTDSVRLRLDPQQLAPLYARNDFRVAVHVSAIVLAIVATLVAAAWIDQPMVFAVAFVAIGALQHHLSIIHHESVHRLLFRSRWLNELVGSAAAFSTGFSMAYRTHHLAHHLRLGSEDDPDLDAYGSYPTNRTRFFADVVWHLCGGGAVQQFVRQAYRVRRLSPAQGATSRFQLLGIVATQVLLFALFAACGRPELYFLLWVLPLVVVAKTLTHFRGVVEHTIDPRVNGESRRYRTILCGPLERFFFAPMNFNFHAEHHFYPAIPYYNLPQAFRLLSSNPAYRGTVCLDRGYLAFLFRQASKARGNRRDGSMAHIRRQCGPVTDTVDSIVRREESGRDLGAQPPLGE